MKPALNLGCGPLCIDEYMGYHFINIDHDLMYEEYARGCEFMHHDIREGLPFPDGSIGFINCSQTFEHLNMADGMKLLDECYRVLEHAGKVRVSVPDADLIIQAYLAKEMARFAGDQPKIYSEVESQMLKFGMLLFGAMHEHGDTGHKMAYSYDALNELFTKAGFSSVERVEFDPVLDAINAKSHQVAVTALKQ